MMTESSSTAESYDALQRCLTRISPWVAAVIDGREEASAVVLLRSHVLATLRLLNGGHKGVLLEFLYQAGLIGGFGNGSGSDPAARLSLSSADLRYAELRHLGLGRAQLIATILNEADCRHCYLAGANLGGADLINTNLAGADLTEANLALADLSGANLAGAVLIGAKVTPRQLEQAADVEGVVGV